MKATLILVTLLVIILTSQSSVSQGSFSGNYVKSLEIESGEFIVYSGDSLRIDSLSMGDQSQLIIQNDAYIVIRSAAIGEKCSISAEGLNGTPGRDGDYQFIDGLPGNIGERGRNLTLVINLESLKSLSISTKGGNGGPGGSGYYPERNTVPGATGFDGGDGGPGGSGGDGGHLKLYYSSREFIPIVNKVSEHSLYINTAAGSCGKPGKPGEGGSGGSRSIIQDPKTGRIIQKINSGARGRSGKTGTGCRPALDGEVVLMRL